MNAAEIKIDLFRKLDSLKGKRLEEAYGMLLNYINGKSEVDEWQNLTTEQQSAIRHGIEQLDNGLGRKHSDVMSDFRNRFANE
jgi:predicted transcriptional regulator